MIVNKPIPTIHAVAPRKTPYQVPLKSSETVVAAALLEKTKDSILKLSKGQNLSILV